MQPGIGTTRLPRVQSRRRRRWSLARASGGSARGRGERGEAQACAGACRVLSVGGKGRQCVRECVCDCGLLRVNNRLPTIDDVITVNSTASIPRPIPTHTRTRGLPCVHLLAPMPPVSCRTLLSRMRERALRIRGQLRRRVVRLARNKQTVVRRRFKMRCCCHGDETAVARIAHSPPAVRARALASVDCAAL
jgi:hypothetical protein